jgi:hypothetical protein
VRQVFQGPQENEEREFGIGVADTVIAQCGGKRVDVMQCAVMSEIVGLPVHDASEGMCIGELRMSARGAPDMRDEVPTGDFAFNHHVGQRTVGRRRRFAKHMGIAILCEHDAPAVAVAVRFAAFASETIKRVFDNGGPATRSSRTVHTYPTLQLSFRRLSTRGYAKNGDCETQ